MTYPGTCEWRRGPKARQRSLAWVASRGQHWSRLTSNLSTARRHRLSLALAVLACAALSIPAAPRSVCAQTPTSGALTLAGGRLALGAQASASIGTDDQGYFNYSTYDYGLLRLATIDAAADLRLNDRLSLLGDLRLLVSTDSGHSAVSAHAAFVRVRPFAERAFDIQAGLVPPVFGVFSRRAYDTDNPLIGYPLAYQYLTSLRSDALPSSLGDLLRMRGRGWRATYPIGEPTPGEGVPLVDGVRYQSGIEAHIGNLQPFEAGIAWTAGSLSTPRYEDGNAGKQVSGRVAISPITGAVIGLSAARGSFLSRPLLDAVADRSSGNQTALGFDAEYARGHWLLRGEGVLSRWRIPRLSDVGAPVSLQAFGLDIEGRYRLTPALYLAARVDRLAFSDVSSPDGNTPWDAPVRRMQIGGGYSVFRQALVKAEWQRNYRDTAGTAGSYGTSGRDTFDLVSAQLVVWF